MAQLQLFHINYFTNFIIRDAVKPIAVSSVYSASEMAMESMLVQSSGRTRNEYDKQKFIT